MLVAVEAAKNGGLNRHGARPSNATAWKSPHYFFANMGSQRFGEK
jgi:hypothetical protein